MIAYGEWSECTNGKRFKDVYIETLGFGDGKPCPENLEPLEEGLFTNKRFCLYVLLF